MPGLLTDILLSVAVAIIIGVLGIFASAASKWLQSVSNIRSISSTVSKFGLEMDRLQSTQNVAASTIHELSEVLYTSKLKMNDLSAAIIQVQGTLGSVNVSISQIMATHEVSFALVNNLNKEQQEQALAIDKLGASIGLMQTSLALKIDELERRAEGYEVMMRRLDEGYDVA